MCEITTPFHTLVVALIRNNFASCKMFEYQEIQFVVCDEYDCTNVYAISIWIYAVRTSEPVNLLFAVECVWSQVLCALNIYYFGNQKSLNRLNLLPTTNTSYGIPSMMYFMDYSLHKPIHLFGAFAVASMLHTLSSAMHVSLNFFQRWIPSWNLSNALAAPTNAQSLYTIPRKQERTKHTFDDCQKSFWLFSFFHLVTYLFLISTFSPKYWWGLLSWYHSNETQYQFTNALSSFCNEYCIC